MKNKLIPAFCAIFLFWAAASAQVYNDATLAQVREKDKAARVAGKLPVLPVADHLYRADVYMSNRAFAEAREHWQIVLSNYPMDAGITRALFGLGRSFMWERQYQTAIGFFERLIQNHLDTKDGREGLAFKGACLVRLGRNLEAAQTYQQYVTMFPTGEKIDSAHLNIIDAYREAGKYSDANLWVDKTRQRFSGMPPETNALFARLRMEIFLGEWQLAVKAADDLRTLNDFDSSMSSLDEVTYFKGHALEKMGRKTDAVSAYFYVSDNLNSFYGNLATERLLNLTANDPARRAQALDRQARAKVAAKKAAAQYPAPYQTELIRYAKNRGVDPRFVLAIMKQESSFRANAKSPAAARGLLQLTADTAAKYNVKAGVPNLQPELLYQPGININIGSYYLAEIKREFNLYEAIAASYNAGEDNAARWLNRSKPKEAAVFAAEVGFAETKNYVFKVMGNYRVYRELYTEDLRKR